MLSKTPTHVIQTWKIGSGFNSDSRVGKEESGKCHFADYSLLVQKQIAEDVTDTLYNKDSI